MFGIPISTSAAISGYRLTVERITRIANNLDCFVDLPMMDQTNLLKENADLLVSLRGAIFFDSKKKGVNQVLISMGIGKLKDGEDIVIHRRSFKLRLRSSTNNSPTAPKCSARYFTATLAFLLVPLTE